MALLAAIAAPVWAQAAGAPAQPEQKKSAEEILNGLLGGSERGIGGVRTESNTATGGTAKEPPHIAVPIHFKYNAAEVTRDSFAQLDQVAQALKDSRLSGSRIRVEGHTDNQGTDVYNRSLSQRRAAAVKQYLVDKEGIAAARLIAVGYGKSRPLPGIPQDTEEGRAANRRVEFANLGTGPMAAAASPAKPDRPKLSVNVAVKYEKGGETRVLTPGGVLTPNDNYRVIFTPTQNSYVYVYQIDSHGKATAVFPNPDYSASNNPVPANRAYSVPPEGHWLTLDQQPGEEEIVVLASERPLPDAMVLAQQLRAPALAGAVRGPAADVRTDVAPQIPAGVFSYRFPFEHR